MTHQTIAPEPTTAPPSSGFVQFVLDQLNVARIRTLLAVNEIETTMTALSGGIISAEAAILILAETDLSLVEASS